MPKPRRRHRDRPRAAPPPRHALARPTPPAPVVPLSTGTTAAIIDAIVSLVAYARTGPDTTALGGVIGAALATLRAHTTGPQQYDLITGWIVGQLVTGQAYLIDRLNAADPGAGDQWLTLAAEHAAALRR